MTERRLPAKKKKWQIAHILVMMTLVLGLSGCTLPFGEDEPDHTQQGYDALEILDYEQAKSQFEAALAANEKMQPAYRGLGMAYLGLSDYEKAISAFEAALRQSKGSVKKMEYDISYYLAVAEFKNGDIDGAYQTYSAIIGMNEKDAMAHYLRGKVLLKKGDLENAMFDFDEAVKLAPNDYDMYIRMYEDLEACGHPEEASIYITRAMDNNEKMNEYQLGVFHYYLGAYEDARNYLEKSRTGKNDKQNGEKLVMYLGKTYEALGDLNYAISLYQTYLDKNPTSAAAYVQLGLSKMKQQDYQGALSAFEGGIAINDANYMQSLLFNQVVAYEYMNEFKKASVSMEEYLKMYPDDETARREYEFLKTR